MARSYRMLPCMETTADRQECEILLWWDEVNASRCHCISRCTGSAHLGWAEECSPPSSYLHLKLLPASSCLPSSLLYHFFARALISIVSLLPSCSRSFAGFANHMNIVTLTPRLHVPIVYCCATDPDGGPLSFLTPRDCRPPLSNHRPVIHTRPLLKFEN